MSTKRLFFLLSLALALLFFPHRALLEAVAVGTEEVGGVVAAGAAVSGAVASGVAVTGANRTGRLLKNLCSGLRYPVRLPVADVTLAVRYYPAER
jgi:hypothetical protein